MDIVKVILLLITLKKNNIPFIKSVMKPFELYAVDIAAKTEENRDIDTVVNLSAIQPGTSVLLNNWQWFSVKEPNYWHH